MHDIQEAIHQWLEVKQPVAIATVVETWGSAPRSQGAKMAVRPDLAMAGSVSGGCVEGAVVEEMLAALEEGKGRLLKYGVSDDTAWDVGLACGGSIRVFAEPLNQSWWQAILDLTEKEQKSCTITVINGDQIGEKLLLNASGEVVYATTNSDILLNKLDQYMAVQTSSPLQLDNDVEVFVDVHHTRPHLIIIGGVHIAIPLQSYARQLGFRVSIVDPRRAFATSERFPDVDTIMHEYPDKALVKLGLNEQTYLAVLTHDPKIDDPALITALPSTIPYIGVLSSSKTHQKRLKRLTEAGISQELQDRITTPIGLDIRARTPEEIALCIMAEIIAVRNGAVV